MMGPKVPHRRVPSSGSYPVSSYPSLRRGGYWDSMPEIAEKQTDIVDFLWRNDVVPGAAPGDCGVDAVWSKLPNYPYRLGIFAVRHHPRISRRSF